MFSAIVKQKVDEGLLPKELALTIESFYNSFKSAVEAEGMAFDEAPLCSFLECVVDEVQHPFEFQPYHTKVREPFDYYQMGLDVFRPLIQFEKCRIIGDENIRTAKAQIDAGGNVIFFANHQAEPDPQVISLLLEKKYPKLAEEMIFVAGHRVVTDPLAKPFSRGRNLLCIYSKRYIESPPELQHEKQLHNQQTMKKMSQLLAEGGKCIYVAPSGGRDRPGPDGKPEVAPFDRQSIEMFRLMAEQAGRPTHYYPMSLFSFNLLPPPTAISKELGEARTTMRTPIHLAIGEEIDMAHFPGSEEPDKKLRRQNRADYIWKLVKQGYQSITEE